MYRPGAQRRYLWEEIETWECYALGRQVGMVSLGKESAASGVWVNSKLYWLSRQIEQTGEPAECGVISQGKMKFQRKGVRGGSIVVKLDECF